MLKKFGFYLFCTIFLFSTAAYAEIDHKATLSEKISANDGSSFFVLSDGSCWRVYGFQIRWRGVVEWFRGVQLITPENCDCKPDDWVRGSDIEAYPRCDGIDMDISDAGNLDALKKCTHILMNTKNEQILFGTPLLTGDCMIDVYNDAKVVGYNRGYSEGFSSGHQIGQWTNEEEAYFKGHDDGYEEGYTAGYQVGSQQGVVVIQ